VLLKYKTNSGGAPPIRVLNIRVGYPIHRDFILYYEISTILMLKIITAKHFNMGINNMFCNHYPKEAII